MPREKGLSMTIEDVIRACGGAAELVPDPGAEVRAVYTSDLLSDVMAHAPAGSVLVTIQNHANTVAVALLAGIRLILICHQREIPDEMRRAAMAEGIALARTPLDQFGASCALDHAGLGGGVR
jgi:hypothetical protein